MQAQQRYRERRKQKFSEMEESLNVLASQVEQMSSVQSQNSLLQVRQRLSHAHPVIGVPSHIHPAVLCQQGLPVSQSTHPECRCFRMRLVLMVRPD